MNIMDEIQSTINAGNGNIFRIVYYGPSTTSASYVFPNWGEIIRYVVKNEMYDRMNQNTHGDWNVQTYNVGLDGGTSRDLLEYLDELVVSLHPSMVFLSLGKNDGYLGVSMEETRFNAQKIISRLLKAGSRVVLITNPPSVDAKLNEKVRGWFETEKLLAETVTDERFHFINLFEDFPKEHLDKMYTLVNKDGNPDVGIKPGEVDPVHYNKLGNAIVASLLLKEIFEIVFDPFEFISDVQEGKVLFPGW